MCGFTCLVPTKGSATKQYEFVGQKWEKRSDYDQLFAYTGHDVDDLNNVDDLGGCVEAIVESGSDCIIVRGGLTPYARQAIERDPDALLNRRREATGADDHPSLADIPRQWVMIDIDAWTIPPHLALYDRDDHPLIIEAAVHALLHPAFHDVRGLYQFSASCGVTSTNILKVHLWYWLTEPIANNALRAIVRHHMPDVDYCPCNAVQPHFITSPVLRNGHDPLPARLGWIKGAEDVVQLPFIPKAERKPPVAGSPVQQATGQNWLAARLARMGADKDGFYSVTRDLIWDYSYRVSAGYVARNDDALIKAIQHAIARANQGERTEADIRLYSDGPRIQKLINDALHKRTI